LTLKDVEIVRYRVLTAENMVMIIVFCGLSWHVFGSNIPLLPGKKKPWRWKQRCLWKGGTYLPDCTLHPKKS